MGNEISAQAESPTLERLPLTRKDSEPKSKPGLSIQTAISESNRVDVTEQTPPFSSLPTAGSFGPSSSLMTPGVQTAPPQGFFPAQEPLRTRRESNFKRRTHHAADGKSVFRQSLIKQTVNIPTAEISAQDLSEKEPDIYDILERQVHEDIIEELTSNESLKQKPLEHFIAPEPVILKSNNHSLNELPEVPTKPVQGPMPVDLKEYHVHVPHMRRKSSMRPLQKEVQPEAPVLSRAVIKPVKGNKFNSCSTLCINSTVTSTDTQQILKFLAVYYSQMINENIGKHDSVFIPILAEQDYPISCKVKLCESVPSQDEIYGLLSAVFEAADLPASHAIITTIYVQRMLKNAGISLQTSNWARSILASVVLTSKVWEDCAVWNVDFHQIFPDWPVVDINNLERWYMFTLKYDLNVKPGEYTKSFFDLTQLASKLNMPIPKPITISEMHRIEGKSSQPKQSKPLEEIDLESISSYHLDQTSETGSRQHNVLRRVVSDFYFEPGNVPANVM